MRQRQQKRGNVYLKAGIWAVVAEILVRAVSFLTTPIFSRILPVEVYGEVKTFESWLSILAPILSLGLFTNIEIAQYQFKEKFKQYVSATMFLIICIHGAVFCLAMMFRTQLCSVLGFTHSMLVVTVLYCCFYSCILCLMRAQRILLDYKGATLLSLLATVPSVLLSVWCCAHVSGLSDNALLDVRVVSFYTPVILIGAVAAGIFIFHQHTFVQMNYWRYALKVSVPLIMYQISLQILTQSDRVMIKYMVGSAEAAIFSIGTTVIYIVEVLHKGLESAWIPWLYRQLEKRKFDQIQKTLYGILGGFGVLFVGTMLLGKEIVFVLGGHEYAQAVWLLGPMLAGVIFQFLMLKLADIEKFYQKGSYVGAVSILIALLNLGLNYIGILWGGYRMAAYTTMLSYIVSVVIHLRLIAARIPELKLPSLRLCSICGGIAALVVAMTGVYYLADWCRYIALVGIALSAVIVTWRNREKLRVFWRKRNVS